MRRRQTKRHEISAQGVLIVRTELATVYSCPYCARPQAGDAYIRVPKGQPGVGRAYGLRKSGAAHATVAAHVRREHPDKLTESF